MASQLDLDPNRRVTDFELGWLIGILEGEGTFKYSRGKFTHGITVSMGDKDTILRVQDIMSRLLGARVALGEITPIKAEYSTMHTASVTGERARTLMRFVVKYMSYRRRQKIWQALNKFTPKKIDLAEFMKSIGK